MCLVLEYNPHAPVIPGNPGLFFSSGYAFGDTSADTERTIVRVRSTTPALWQYMGEYRMHPSESLTIAEYMAQPLVVRKTWAKGVLEKEWEGLCAVEIYYPKVHGRSLTHQEVTDVLKDTKRLKEIRSQLSEENVITAYERGEEENGIWAMKCVGYDVEFQRTLARNYRQYEHKLKARVKA
ncbi:hypothetical protein C8Q72DRAFT_805779 [Fomitopsis betulina]|nr:hypothetical protein C8Q72DRAFT_805779 [Fomitopsis betulina]